MERVTVLMGTFSQKKMIYDAVDSVLMQDYGNIQLIVADDGTKGFSVSRLQTYIKEKNRGNLTSVVIRSNKENLGTVRNLNFAREEINGDYVIPLAGDDAFFDKKVVSHYVKCFRKYSEEQVIVSQVINYDEFLDKKLTFCLNSFQKKLLKSKNIYHIYGYLCLDCFIPAIGTAYRAGILKEMGKYDERYYLIEDWPFYLKMFRMGIGVQYADFISSKHRLGGVSHVVKKKQAGRNKKKGSQDQYHRDLIEIIKNEILPYYNYAPEEMRGQIYKMAHDRIVISNYRKTNGVKEKIQWLYRNPDVGMVFFRGCRRKWREYTGIKSKPWN